MGYPTARRSEGQQQIVVSYILGLTFWPAPRSPPARCCLLASLVRALNTSARLPHKKSRGQTHLKQPTRNNTTTNPRQSHLTSTLLRSLVL